MIALIFMLTTILSIEPDKIKDGQNNVDLTYYKNLNYLKKNCTINFRKENDVLNILMSKLYYTGKSLPSKSNNFIIDINEDIKYKKLDFKLTFVFNHADFAKIKDMDIIDKKGFSGVLDLRIDGSIAIDKLDINKKDFQNYIFEKYAQMLSKNNILLEDLKIKEMKDE